MLKKERHAFIIRQINLHNKVLSSDLGLQLQVSEDTVRRDLNELAENGKIIKVHGGALSKSFHFPYEQKDVYAQDSKKEVARKAIGLISEGMTVLTGGGTTMLEMARLVPDDLEATFFTISPVVALELAEKKLLTVNLIGGTLNKNAQVNMGAKTISDLSEIGVDLCFLGTNGIDLKEGITDSEWEVLQVKKAMIKASARIAIMCISEKLNSVKKMKVCSLSTIDYLITDLSPTDPKLRPYEGNTKII
ncbi:MAG: DeoR/GlpR family DNA-binding transcription regulator [Daejeonella sp.]